MSQARLSVRIADSGKIYTNGDTIKGTITLTTFSNLTLRSIQVFCRCTVVAFVTIGDHTRVVEHQHLFQKSQRKAPGCGAVPAESDSDKVTLAPGNYTFQFEFTLPDAQLSLPESFESNNDISGIFWHIRARVDRGSASRFQRAIIAQSNFAFMPQLPLPVTEKTCGVSVRKKNFSLSIAGPRMPVAEYFTKKKCSPIQLNCSLSYPTDGLPLDDYTTYEIRLGLSCDTEDAIFLERLSVSLREHTKVCCISSRLSSEKALVCHPVAIYNPHTLLSRDESNFVYLISPHDIHDIAAGTIDIPHLHHTFDLSVSMVVSQAVNPKRQQVITFVSELLVQPRHIYRFGAMSSSPALAY